MDNKEKVMGILQRRVSRWTLARVVGRAGHILLKRALPVRFYERVEAHRIRARYALPFHRIFRQIAIETRTDCNLKCEFCPQSTKPRPKQIMSEDLFKKIIDDLAAIEYAGRIAPTVNNEPLLDDRILSFIAYARKRCPFSFLHLITNGTQLNIDMVKELFAIGLDELLINDYRKDRLNNPFRVSRNLVPIAELSKKMFGRKIRISFRSSVGVLTNRAGNCRGREIKLPLRQFCIRPFFEMVIQPEGRAVLCCQDYTYEEIMGDTSISSVADIWFNEKYHRIRAELYEGERAGKICEKCDFNGLS